MRKPQFYRPWQPSGGLFARRICGDNQAMTSRARGRFATTVKIVAMALLVTAGAWAKDKVKPFEPPKAFHANTYPAVDKHADEKVSIAADPYDMADKAVIFTVNYADEGILPVRIIISNDGEAPVALNQMEIELVTKRKIKLTPMTNEALHRRLSHMEKRADEQSSRFPIPLPHKSKNTVSEQAESEYEAAQFLARAVEPHTTRAGFIFLDVDGIDHPLAGGYLDVSGIRNGEGQELLYFEIALEKYLTYQPGTPTEAPQR